LDLIENLVAVLCARVPSSQVRRHARSRRGRDSANTGPGR
jgi:hypothetical protein